jgi:hypothetical protein
MGKALSRPSHASFTVVQFWAAPRVVHTRERTRSSDSSASFLFVPESGCISSALMVAGT